MASQVSNDAFRTIFPRYAQLLSENTLPANESIEQFLRDELPRKVEMVRNMESCFNAFLTHFTNIVLKRPQHSHLLHSLVLKANDKIEKYFQTLSLKVHKMDGNEIKNRIPGADPQLLRKEFKAKLESMGDLLKQKYFSGGSLARECEEQVTMRIYVLFQIYHFLKGDPVAMASKFRIGEHEVLWSVSRNEEPGDLTTLITLDPNFIQNVEDTVLKRNRPFISRRELLQSKVRQALRQGQSRVGANLNLFVESMLSKERGRVSRQLSSSLNRELRSLQEGQGQDQIKDMINEAESLKRQFAQIKNTTYFLDIMRGNFSQKYKMEINRLENVFYLTNLEKYLQDVSTFLEKVLALQQKIIRNRKEYMRDFGGRVDIKIADLIQFYQSKPTGSNLTEVMLQQFQLLESALYGVISKKEVNHVIDTNKKEQRQRRDVERRRQMELKAEEDRRRREEEKIRIEERRQQEEERIRKARIEREEKDRQRREESERAERARREELQRRRQQKARKDEELKELRLEQQKKKDEEKRQREAEDKARRQEQARKRAQEQDRKNREKEEQRRRREDDRKRIIEKQEEEKRKRQLDLKQRRQKQEQDKIRRQNERKSEEERLKKQKEQKQAQNRKRQQEKQRQEKEKREKQQREAEERRKQDQRKREEKQRQAKEQKEAEERRKQQERKDRQKKEQQERDRKQRERKEKEAQMKRKEEERKKQEEKLRLEKEKKQKEAKQQRQRKQKAEQERIAKEKEEKKRKEEEEKARKEKERKQREQKDRVEREKAEKLQRQRLQKIQREKREKERIEKEKRQAEEKSRLEKERKERQERQKKQREERQKKQREERQRKQREERQRKERQEREKKAEAQRKKKEEEQKAKSKKTVQPKKSSGINYGDFDDILDDDLEQMEKAGKIEPSGISSGFNAQDEYDQQFDQEPGAGEQISTKELISVADLKCLNDYMKGTSYARKNKVNAELVNKSSKYLEVFEEFIQNKKLFIFDAAISKAVMDLGVELTNPDTPEQDLHMSIDTIKEEMLRAYDQILPGEEMFPVTKYVYPFSFQNEFNIRLIEMIPGHTYFKVIFNEALPSDEAIGEKFQCLIEGLLHLFQLEGEPTLEELVVNNETKLVLDTFDRDIPCLLLLFALHYEQANPKNILINQYTIQRLFYTSNVVEHLYDAMKEGEVIEEFFNKMAQKYSTNDKIKIFNIAVNSSDPEYSQQLTHSALAIKQEFKKGKQATVLVCFSIEIEEEGELTDKIVVYMSLDRASPKTVCNYFLVSKDAEEQENSTVIFQLISQGDQNFDVNVYTDYTRHNCLSTYSDWTLPLWAHAITKRKLSSLQAIRALTFAMTPYYLAYKEVD